MDKSIQKPKNNIIMSVMGEGRPSFAVTKENISVLRALFLNHFKSFKIRHHGFIAMVRPKKSTVKWKDRAVLIWGIVEASLIEKKKKNI